MAVAECGSSFRIRKILKPSLAQLKKGCDELIFCTCLQQTDDKQRDHMFATADLNSLVQPFRYLKKNS